jgi:hypothetical protein
MFAVIFVFIGPILAMPELGIPLVLILALIKGIDGEP